MSSDDIALTLLNNNRAHYGSLNQSGYGFGGVMMKAADSIKNIASVYGKYYAKKAVKDAAMDVLKFHNPEKAFKKHFKKQARELLASTLMQTGREIIDGRAFGLKRKIPREGYKFTNLLP